MKVHLISDRKLIFSEPGFKMILDFFVFYHCHGNSTNNSHMMEKSIINIVDCYIVTLSTLIFISGSLHVQSRV